LKVGVGLLLILYSAWMGLVRRPPIVRGGGKLADAAVGFIGGLMGGMTSLSGPAPVIWAQLRGWNMHEQRGVNQPFNMAVLALAVITSAVAGFLDRRFFIFVVLALPTTLIGARFGLSLYGKVDDRQFRLIVLSLLGVSGATLIASSFS